MTRAFKYFQLVYSQANLILGSPSKVPWNLSSKGDNHKECGIKNEVGLFACLFSKYDSQINLQEYIFGEYGNLGSFVKQ